MSVTEVGVLRSSEKAYAGLHVTILGILLFVSAVLNFALASRLHTLTVSRSAPSLNKQMESISAKDMNGVPVNLDLRAGKPFTVVYIYRPSCGWCAKNLQNVKQLARQIQSKQQGAIIGVSLENDDLREYVVKSELGFPSYSDLPFEFQREYQLGATPETLVVENGKVVRDWRGAWTDETHGDVEKFFGVRLPGLVQ